MSVVVPGSKSIVWKQLAKTGMPQNIRILTFAGYSGSAADNENFAKSAADKPSGFSSLSNSCIKTSWTGFNPNSFLSGPTQHQETHAHSFHYSGFDALPQLLCGTYECLASSTRAYQHYPNNSSNNGTLSAGADTGRSDSVVEFPFQNLKFVGKVADWHFGEVRKFYFIF